MRGFPLFFLFFLKYVLTMRTQQYIIITVESNTKQKNKGDFKMTTYRKNNQIKYKVVEGQFSKMVYVYVNIDGSWVHSNDFKKEINTQEDLEIFANRHERWFK